MRFLIWSLAAGMLVSVMVTWWPSSWLYAPGIIFGLSIATYFFHDAMRAHRHAAAIGGLVGFVVLSYASYIFALHEAEWILGTNGFASFASYEQSSALAALFVGVFVGGCLGAFLLALGMRVVFFRFDIIRGLFLFSIFSGALGSVIAAGFETFGFWPQFLFPIWHCGMAAVIIRLHKRGLREKEDEEAAGNLAVASA